MSEEIPKPKVVKVPDAPTTPPTDKESPIDALLTQIKSITERLSKLETPTPPSDKPTDTELGKMTKELKDRLDKAEKEADNAKKTLILENIKVAGFDIESFKGLSLDSLSAVQLSLSKISKDIIIQKKEETPKKNVVVRYDPKTKLYVPYDTL